MNLVCFLVSVLVMIIILDCLGFVLKIVLNWLKLNFEFFVVIILIA